MRNRTFTGLVSLSRGSESGLEDLQHRLTGESVYDLADLHGRFGCQDFVANHGWFVRCWRNAFRCNYHRWAAMTSVSEDDFLAGKFNTA